MRAILLFVILLSTILAHSSSSSKAKCGNGLVEKGEKCDDGGVGCKKCEEEVKGWECWTHPSTKQGVCTKSCKNLKGTKKDELKAADPSTICEDGNNLPGDGCS